MDHSDRTLLRTADRARLAAGVFRSVAEQEKAIQAYIAAKTADPKPFRWTKDAEDILASIQRFSLRPLAAKA